MALLFGWLGVEPSFLEFHHKTIFLAGPFEDLHGLLETVRISDLHFDHNVFTALS